MKDIFEQLHDFGLVPVIKITKVENAVPLAKALKEKNAIIYFKYTDEVIINIITTIKKTNDFLQFICPNNFI